MRDATPRVSGTALKSRLQPAFTAVIAKPGKIPTSQQRLCANSPGRVMPSRLFCSGPARRLPQAVEPEAKGTCPRCSGTGRQGCGQGCRQGSTHSPHQTSAFITRLCSQQRKHQHPPPCPGAPPASQLPQNPAQNRISPSPPTLYGPPLPAKDDPSSCGRGLSPPPHLQASLTPASLPDPHLNSVTELFNSNAFRVGSRSRLISALPQRPWQGRMESRGRAGEGGQGKSNLS